MLERPSVLSAAAVLYIGQFVVGKIPMLDSVWDVVHTALRPVVGGAIGVVMARHTDANSAATIAAAADRPSRVVVPGITYLPERES